MRSVGSRSCCSGVVEPGALQRTCQRVDPTLGGAFTLLLQDLPPAQPVVGVLGMSSQTWNGTPLPLSLAPFGGEGPIGLR